MEKIEIMTPEPDKVLPILQDAIERQKQLLSQSLVLTQERIKQLAARLRVDPEQLLTTGLPHTEGDDMELLELEGEIEIYRHLQEQFERLEHLQLCS